MTMSVKILADIWLFLNKFYCKNSTDIIMILNVCAKVFCNLRSYNFFDMTDI